MLPQLELFDAPLGYFACNLSSAVVLHSIKIKYPTDEYTIHSIYQSNLEQIWRDGTLAVMLPQVQDITLDRMWGWNNVDLVFWVAKGFGNICSLEVHGYYWMVYLF